MRHTNVKLSPHESELVTDAEIILTKNGIIEKVYLLFGELIENVGVEMEKILPPEVAAIRPKIYKGERYEELPYVLLDYPRYFKKDATFAVRCFFWWGNFFSITLHLSGGFKDAFLKNIVAASDDELLQNWIVNTGENEWDHSLKDVQEINRVDTLEVAFEQWRFIKLSKKIPLQKWDDAYDFFAGTYLEIIKFLRY